MSGQVNYSVATSTNPFGSSELCIGADPNQSTPTCGGACSGPPEIFFDSQLTFTVYDSAGHPICNQSVNFALDQNSIPYDFNGFVGAISVYIYDPNTLGPYGPDTSIGVMTDGNGNAQVAFFTQGTVDSSSSNPCYCSGCGLGALGCLNCPGPQEVTKNLVTTLNATLGANATIGTTASIAITANICGLSVCS